jgi:hypothetical protein
MIASGIVPDNDCINKKAGSFSILQIKAYSYSATPLLREQQPLFGKGLFFGKYQRSIIAEAVLVSWP